MKRTLAYVFVLLAFLDPIRLQGISGQSVGAVNASLYNVLYIAIAQKGEYVHILAQNDRETRTERLEKADFRKVNLDLYKALESRRLSDATGQRMIEELGLQILRPFQTLIETADEIVFIVSYDLLETPLDLLYHKGQPLFLQKPVSYRVTQPLKRDPEFSLPASALVISDITADPERAAKTVANNFANSLYLDVTKVDPKYFRQQRAFDLLLMSVHGQIDNTAADHIVLGHGSGTATDFLTIRPRLVYFDSCRLGVSGRFLNAFLKIGSLYFVAPVLSNEAGNSSTRTMLLFFKHLQQGMRPELALFHTRKKLWDTYRDDRFAYRVWRAFPFRIYRLN